MSGKAILVLVVGIVIITGTVMYNIEAASTRIVRNYGDYYLRQSNQNLAQSGVSIAYTQLKANRNWRVGYSGLAILNGKVDVKVFDTKFDSIPVIAIQSIGTTDFGSGLKRRDTSTAYVFWSVRNFPLGLKALLTLNANATANGSATIDGRNHDLNGAVISGTGIPAVWTTAPSFTVGSSSVNLGGTDNGLDYVPANPAPPQVIKTNQTYVGGFPQTPDSVMGGLSATFPEGTLKAIAKSGIGGSQYVTDPTKVIYPLRGVTYVDMPASPANIWSATDVTGSGILIIHNTQKSAVMSNAKGNFKGLIMADDMVHLHGYVLGGVVIMKNTLSGNVIGNGNMTIAYSEQAIKDAAKFLEVDGGPALVGWWE